jgi:hypothetical protein
LSCWMATLQVWQSWELEAVLAKGSGVRDASKDAAGMAALRRVELAGDVADLVSSLGGMSDDGKVHFFAVVWHHLAPLQRATSQLAVLQGSAAAIPTSGLGITFAHAKTHSARMHIQLVHALDQ